MRLPWLARVALAAAPALVLACGVASPSGTGSSPAVSSAPTMSALPDLTLAPSPTPVPAVTDDAEDGVFRIELVQPDGGGRLPVVLTDLTGLVVGIEAHPPDMVVMEDDVSNPAGAPNVLTYGWIGGACDTMTSITFQRTEAGFRLSNTTKTTGDICILIALSRVIDIHLSQPIDADAVVVGDR